MTDDPYRYFRIEARELLDELVKGALDLERGAPATSALAGMLRHAHTLKGAARVVKQPEIADHAHAIEDALDPFRDITERVPEEQVEAVLRLVDAIGGQLASLPAAGEEPAAAGTTGTTADRPPPDRAVRTIRAEITEIDELLNGIGETHAQLGSARLGVGGIGRARELVDLVVFQLAKDAPGDTERPESRDRARRARRAAAELQLTLAEIERRLESDVEQIDRELRQLRDAAEHLRLLPARALFTDLERAARDVAQAQGKHVEFEGTGGEVRLDAHVLAAAQGALHQIVRNAVAHGIETANERSAAGKPAAGRVRVGVARRGRRVVFVCHDDGRGIDLEAVRDVARRRGLLADSSADLGPEDLVRLLLRGGISTSGAVTELSGRGIGLDVLRDAAARLGGEITVTTKAGKGTTVELEAPLSLASLDALAVAVGAGAGAGAVTALIPLDAVEQTLRVRTEEIHVGPLGASLTYEGKVVPFLRLAAAFGEERATGQVRGAFSAVILTGAAGLAAIGVHRLLGTSNIVVRPLPDRVAGSPLVSGVWLDEEGNPQLVLDPDGLVVEARRDRERFLGEDDAPLDPILVVDDSLTTRMLEQSILESANYLVEVASSAEEALVKAQAKRYLLFLVDVEMPGMDGFTFIERTRADPALCDVPAILVTSRSSQEDRQRGFDAGASAYVTKGEFDQGKLLERIAALTAR